MAARRVLILIAVLLGASALAASLSPPPPRAPATDEVRLPPAQTEAPEVEVQRVSAAERDQEIEGRVGRRLRFEVSAVEFGAVQLGDTGPIESVQPDSPARFDLLPERPGEIELRLLDSDQVIARVKIRG